MLLGVNTYAMCPCCGRSMLVDEVVKGDQRPLWDSGLGRNALEHGGEVWTHQPKGRKPGGGAAFERGAAPAALSKRVLAELVRRCKAFLEKVEG